MNQLDKTAQLFSNVTLSNEVGQTRTLVYVKYFCCVSALGIKTKVTPLCEGKASFSCKKNGVCIKISRESCLSFVP